MWKNKTLVFIHFLSKFTFFFHFCRVNWSIKMCLGALLYRPDRLYFSVWLAFMLAIMDVRQPTIVAKTIALQSIYGYTVSSLEFLFIWFFIRMAGVLLTVHVLCFPWKWKFILASNRSFNKIWLVKSQQIVKRNVQQE